MVSEFPFSLDLVELYLRKGSQKNEKSAVLVHHLQCMPPEFLQTACRPSGCSPDLLGAASAKSRIMYIGLCCGGQEPRDLVDVQLLS